MLDAERVTKLAEAVADGQTPDWSSADQFAADDRELIAELRAVASIGALFGTVSGSGPSHAAARTPLTPGSTWGTLHILAHVGAGRFGDVYKAWDPALDREVALKLMSVPSSDDASGPQVVEEGRLMARVHHPNVVSVFGAQRIGETTGLWMEYVEGRTLAEELSDRGPFGAADLVAVGVDLCRALQAVHEAGLVHRDVKTQNVMRDRRGRVVLGDFGVGRDLQDAEPVAGLAGTPAYIAPEIFARQPATPRSDLYSLGALLFQLATRRYPVEGRSLRSLRDAHENGARASLGALRPDLPVSVTAVIERALSVDPAARYATADEMAAAFEATRAAAPASATRRRQWIATAALVIGVASAAAFSWVRPLPAPAIPFAARDWVLVTAFDNRTGDAVLDGTLEFLLERELSNSSFVNVVPRARVVDTLRLMQQPHDTRLDPTVGREVAVRDGQIRGVIAGRIDKVGAAYTMTASVMNPADGVVFASVSGLSGTQQGLLDAVGRLAVDLRQRLGEALPAMPAPAALPKVTTRSLRALQLYAQAVAMQTPEGTWARKEPAAAQLLTQAIEADPEFASAHMLLSIALRLHQEPRLSEALHHAERAVALSGGVSEVERLVNQAEFYGTSAIVKGTAFRESFTAKGASEITSLREQAMASYEAVLRLEPQHYQALICLVNLQQQSDRRDARIAQYLADLRPQSPVWQMQAAWRLLADNRRADAMRYLERARAFAPIDSPSAFNTVVARLFDAYDAWMREDASQAARIADRVAEDLAGVPEAAVRDFADPLHRVNLALGRLDRAEHFAALNSANALTIVAVFREDRERLRATLAEHYPTVQDGTGVSSAFVDAGLLREARARLSVLKQQSPGAPRTLPGPPAAGVLNYLALVEGQILLAEGRTDSAIAVLDEYLRHQRVGTTGDRWILGTQTLARAWAAKGDFDRAIRLLEAVPWRIDLVAQSSNFNAEWLQVRDHLAQLYRKVGRDREGEAVDTQLLKLLAVADEDHPIRRRATARQAASTASAGSARPFHARDK